MFVTFGRQAKLGGFLVSRRDRTLDALATGKAYLASIAGVELSAEQAVFHLSSYVSGVYALFEGYLLDIAAEMLLCFPDKVRDSEYRIKEMVNGSGDLLSTIVEKQIEALGYKRFDVIVESVMALFHSKGFSSPSIALVQEFKATRDIYVHAGGEWNARYLSKAGSAARPEPRDGRMPLDLAYIKACTDAMIAFVTNFHDQGPRQYERYDRLKALEAMWNASALSGILPFAKAWTVTPGSAVPRPADVATEWAWSHSEELLYGFFLRIYNEHHPAIRGDVLRVFDRWPADSGSGQVMLSWIRDPFFF